MATTNYFRTIALTAYLFCFIPLATGHSWVEQLTLIAPNGTFTGEPGYARGNVARTDPSFDDTKMTNLIPKKGGTKIEDSEKMCKDTQVKPTQSDGNPRLKAAPGAAIALRYQENGHVTIPATQKGKPDNRGTVYVYGTTEPKEDETLLAVHNSWNEDGTGGDRRGLLLSKQNFDDGRCYQINDNELSKERQGKFKHEADKLQGADMWCQQDIRLPENVPADKPYTLYWVWDWPTLPGKDPGLPDGKAETYTTCIDIDISGGGDTKQNTAEGGFQKDQPLGNAAIPEQFEKLNKALKIPNSPEPKSVDIDEPAPSGSPSAGMEDCDSHDHNNMNNHASAMGKHF